MTGEEQSAAAYQAIVGNLLALRDEARNGKHEEVRAMNCILATVMSLQLINRFSRIPVATPQKTKEPILAGTKDRVSKEAPTLLTDNPWTVPRLAEMPSS